MIKCYANVDYSGYQMSLEPDFFEAPFEEFQAWLEPLKEYQLDVETNPVDSMPLAKLRTLQFGEFAPSALWEGDKVQWVIEWTKLTRDQKIWLLTKIQDASVTKYIQNVVFEYQVFLNYNCILENTVDTMLNEKIIYTGYGAFLDEEGATFFSLEGICRRRLGIELDKTYQLLFGHENPLTPGHIVYAAQDVQHLDDIVVQQNKKLDEYYPISEGEERTVFNHIPTLENEAALAFGEIMWNGLKVDQEKWRQNAAEAQPIVDKFLKNVNQYLFEDSVLNARAIELGYINVDDKIKVNWNAPAQRKELLQFAFPDIPGATQPIIKKYLRDNPEISNTQAAEVLRAFSQGDYQEFLDLLLKHCREDLIRMDYLIPPGTLRINWNSPDQVLPLLQAVKKTLKSTDKESMNKLGHPIAFALLDYKETKLLTTTYGLSFLDKIDPDGKVRTRFNQILETGRVSSSDPNVQNIPMIEDNDPLVANKYRNCFIVDTEDQVFVDSDYVSEELVILASLSQDPVWMEAVENGWDLHSICAELVYGKSWIKEALSDCKFYKSKQKCKCPTHSRLRNNIKAVNFLIAYGGSHFKLSANLKIPVKDAEKLIELYFYTFPKIKHKLVLLELFAIKNGYTMTLKPYFRKRWFPEWEKVKHLIEYHIQKIEFVSTLGSIGRMGRNTPIQGCGADTLKLAMVLVRRYINQNNLRDTVKLVMVLHDALTTLSKKHFAEQWKLKLTELMEQAAKVVIPSGLLKADTQISERWTK